MAVKDAPFHEKVTDDDPAAEIHQWHGHLPSFRVDEIERLDACGHAEQLDR